MLTFLSARGQALPSRLYDSNPTTTTPKLPKIRNLSPEPEPSYSKNNVYLWTANIISMSLRSTRYFRRTPHPVIVV